MRNSGELETGAQIGLKGEGRRKGPGFWDEKKKKKPKTRTKLGNRKPQQEIDGLQAGRERMKWISSYLEKFKRDKKSHSGPEGEQKPENPGTTVGENFGKAPEPRKQKREGL